MRTALDHLMESKGASLTRTPCRTGCGSDNERRDPALPVIDVTRLSDWIESGIHRRRVIVAILSAFAVAALLLAAVGLFGVISYSVAQRTREFGVRAAALDVATAASAVPTMRAARADPLEALRAD